MGFLNQPDTSGDQGDNNPVNRLIAKYLQQQIAAADPKLPGNALSAVTEGQKTTGQNTPLTQAVQQTLQQKQEQNALNNQTTVGDQGSAAYGDALKHDPRAMVPFLSQQENALKAHKAAARKQYEATHGPGALPSYLQDDETTPSYIQQNMLDYTAPSRTSWGATAPQKFLNSPEENKYGMGSTTGDPRYAGNSANQYVDNYTAETP
jgi:hypothetical protein